MGLLVKEGLEKDWFVLKFKRFYRKVWLSEPDFKSNKLQEHIKLLDKLAPGYVLDYKVNDSTQEDWHTYIDYRIVPGTPAVEFEPTKEFINKIQNFYLLSLQQYKPYAHWDWSLSNILIDGDNMQLIDWDNVSIFSVCLLYTSPSPRDS